MVLRAAPSNRARLRKRNGLKASTVTFVTFILAAVPACSSDAPGDKPFKASPAPDLSQTAKPVSPDEAAKLAAVDTYKRYWGEMERVYATASVEGTLIKKYAAGAALGRPQADAARMATNGRGFTGHVGVNEPTVTKLDLARKVPSATISSCLDVSAWKVIERDTKKPVALPSNRLTKYVAIATVERWPDGWKVIKDDPQTGQPC